MNKCPTCKGTKKIKDYHVNNHFTQSLKMTWHEIIDCPDCRWFDYFQNKGELFDYFQKKKKRLAMLRKGFKE